VAKPIGLRRYYHRHFGYHTRFHIAVVLTIIVVAYAVVPSVARFVGAIGGYDPQDYQPKDFARQSWLDDKGRMVGLAHVPMHLIVNVLLFLLVALVWLGLVPPGASRRR